MSFDYQGHRARMVDHLIWLEQQNQKYAVEALATYRSNPDCPCPDILTSIKVEKARRASLLSSQPSPSK